MLLYLFLFHHKGSITNITYMAFQLLLSMLFAQYIVPRRSGVYDAVRACLQTHTLLTGTCYTPQSTVVTVNANNTYCSQKSPSLGYLRYNGHIILYAILSKYVYMMARTSQPLDAFVKHALHMKNENTASFNEGTSGIQ